MWGVVGFDFAGLDNCLIVKLSAFEVRMQGTVKEQGLCVIVEIENRRKLDFAQVKSTQVFR